MFGFRKNTAGHRFAKGECYMAIPCLEGLPRIALSFLGRVNGCMVFAEVDPIETVWEDVMDGREVARVRDADGLLYTISAASPAPVAMAAELMQCVRSRKAEVGKRAAK